MPDQRLISSADRRQPMQSRDSGLIRQILTQGL